MMSVQVIDFVAVIGKGKGGVPYGDKEQGEKGNVGFFLFPFNL
jgi:hypothetical protein